MSAKEEEKLKFILEEVSTEELDVVREGRKATMVNVNLWLK
jgi:hypothetical protein